MNRFALAVILASLPLPALAAPPTSDCSDLAQARAAARAVAAPLAYQVFDLDGDNARRFEQDQDVPGASIVDHLSVMTNPKTGRSVALLNDGPHCVFASVLMVLAPHTSPIDSALDALRLAR